MRVRNTKLIILLLVFGIALVVVGVGRLNLSDQAGQSAPASAAASWTAGLIGLALVSAGLVLLRRGYVDARVRLAAHPPAKTLRPTQAVAIAAGAVVAVAVVAVGSSFFRTRATSQQATFAPAQAEPPAIRDGRAPAAPAPTPEMPKSYNP